MVVEVERKTFGRTAGIKAKGLQSPGNSCPVGKQEKKQVFGGKVEQVFAKVTFTLGIQAGISQCQLGQKRKP